MSEQLDPSTEQNDFPEELIGAYSTWKQKSDPEKDSNRHTYLIDADGKKRQISRAHFEERFEQVQLEDEEERPQTSYWSAGAIDSVDPSRTPYAPTEVPAEARPEKSEARGKRGWRKLLGKRALGIFAGGTLALGSVVTSGEYDHNSNYTTTQHDATPTEITIESTPVASPSDIAFEVVEAGTPEATEVATPVTVAMTPTETPVDLTGGAPIATAQVTPEASEPTIVPVSTATAEATSPAIEPLEPSQITDPEVVPAESSVTETDSSQNDVEPVEKTAETLMVSVEVDPGDGVTQVLAKVLAQAGYADMSPAQLFEIYEELVTDPNIGPDAIFEGITLEYNPTAGEYWIQGEGGADVHLTQAAAEWIQSAVLGQ